MDYRDIRKFLRGEGYKVSRREGAIELSYNLGNTTREGTTIILTTNPEQFKEALELGMLFKSKEISFGYIPPIEEATLNLLKNLESHTDVLALFLKKNK